MYPVNYETLHQLEVPKLDGLAVSFLLSTTDAVNHPALYTCLIDTLEPLWFSKTGKPAHYCFLMTWRLLQCLPAPCLC